MHKKLKNAELLIFYWEDNASNSAYAIKSQLKDFPVQAIVVNKDNIYHYVSNIKGENVLSCVLVFSKSSITETSFEEVVNSCIATVSKHLEFRLFVHPHNISNDELIINFENYPIIAELLDTVQISRNTKQNSIQELVTEIGLHLKKFPEILEYLQYEDLKMFGMKLISVVNVIFLIVTLIVILYLGFKPNEMLENEWLPWIMVIQGVSFFFSLISILSFGSTLKTGGSLRFAIAVYPLWVVSNIPTPILIQYLSHLLAGLLLGFLLDYSRRSWAQFIRKSDPLDISENSIEKKLLSLPGHRYWQFLTTAPLIALSSCVFISYSRGSGWGRSTAVELHQKLRELNIPSFIDVKNIKEGSSWRHKIQETIGLSTIFVSIQDDLTFPRKYPTAELASASKSQAYCGVPTIIIFRKKDLSQVNDIQIFNPIIYAIVFARGKIDPLLLRITDCSSNSARNLAEELVDFNTISVIRPEIRMMLYKIIDFVRVFLTKVGAIGTPAGFIFPIIAVLLNRSGVHPVLWLVNHNMHFIFSLFTTFWLGFLIRLIPASRYELKDVQAYSLFWIRCFSTLGLLFLILTLFAILNPLQILYTAITLIFGFIIARDYIITTLSRANQYWESPW